MNSFYFMKRGKGNNITNIEQEKVERKRECMSKKEKEKKRKIINNHLRHQDSGSSSLRVQLPQDQ